MVQGFLSQLQWRRSAKAFDESRPITDEQLSKVLEAIRWAPTSFGIQPFYLKVVRSKKIKQKLKEAGYNQKQFTQCTAALVFVTDLNISDRFEQQLKLRHEDDPAAKKNLELYERSVKKWLSSQTVEFLKPWIQHQIYLALGFALAACAELGVDSCPMEGFNPEKFDEILKLPKAHFSTVALVVGNRALDVPSYPKWRFPNENLFEYVD